MELLRKMFAGKEKERKNGLLIIFLIGLLLITFIPSFTKNETQSLSQEEIISIDSSSSSYERDLEVRLEQILSSVSGAGEVEVMITTNQSSEIVVSENLEEVSNTTNDAEGNKTTEQKTIKKSAQVLGQNEEPLVIKEINPTISGVIIVSSGANDVYVKDALIRSVSTLLDIPSYKVEVLQKNSI